MLKKLLNGVMAQRQAERRAEMYRNLIRHEARIGGQLFGSVKPGVRREFFCLDSHTWVWHEEWTDANGLPKARTTQYDVRPNGIIKAQNGQYQAVSPVEARRLYQAAQQYEQRVTAQLYQAGA